MAEEPGLTVNKNNITPSAFHLSSWQVKVCEAPWSTWRAYPRCPRRRRRPSHWRSSTAPCRCPWCWWGGASLQVIHSEKFHHFLNPRSVFRFANRLLLAGLTSVWLSWTIDSKIYVLRREPKGTLEGCVSTIAETISVFLLTTLTFSWNLIENWYLKINIIINKQKSII